MLVKINNSNEDFSESVSFLKSRFDVGTSSGACLQAVLRYPHLSKVHSETLTELEELKQKLEEIKQAFSDKSHAEDELTSLLQFSTD